MARLAANRPISNYCFTDLNCVRISKPCHASWKNMEKVEDERVRHCRECHLKGNNLTAMSHRDGTIVTADYPNGVEVAKHTPSKRLLRVLGQVWNAFLSFPAATRMLKNSIKYFYSLTSGSLGESEEEFQGYMRRKTKRKVLD